MNIELLIGIGSIYFMPLCQPFYFHTINFVGTPSNIDEYTLKRFCAKNGTFVHLVTIILVSHLTSIAVDLWVYRICEYSVSYVYLSITCFLWYSVNIYAWNLMWKHDIC